MPGLLGPISCKIKGDITQQCWGYSVLYHVQIKGGDNTTMPGLLGPISCKIKGDITQQCRGYSVLYHVR